MPVEVRMPALSPTMETGTLARWLVKPGDHVHAGDPIAEIETDKATMEVEAADEGEVVELVVPEGTEGVAVGAVIARLRTADKAPTTTAAPAPEAAPEGTRARPSQAGDAAAPPPMGDAGPPPPVATDAATLSAARAAADGRVRASPLARRMAAQLGVRLEDLEGSGPGGRIVRADVERAAGRAPAPGVIPAPTLAATAAEAARPTPVAAAPLGPASGAPPGPIPRAPAPDAAPAQAARAAPAPGAAPAQAPRPHEPPFELVPLGSVRRTIARRLTEAKTTIPHFYLSIDCRLDALLALRAEINAALEPRGIKVSVNDMLVKALGMALEAVPEANVSFAGEHLKRFGRADVSVAVAIPGGLVTPIVRDAAAKPLSRIAVEMRDLAERGRALRLKPHEIQGGTASLSNLGMHGVKEFAAVLNPPEAVILAVGAGERRPVVTDDGIGAATLMSVTGSFDHRAIDGAVGARLLQAFRGFVERPLAMLA
ncbi:MAG: 2-oxo acid dehydrogenase subunit E2 [Sphingomonadaceae bacterium]|uniref:2-oxo acid dehydrogenase subunit E2 n=1 Tax=Thermaurantiacus sp. TaxID=2820283 RepID=UPI00298F3600|nr:2-oxo acid dehydrogenase subunit E2 [Thermaurantiacus sp.]MCS6986616.1 2-oxo acid dehydrogenase subunit E2 [Sphingomonadaceae bacterium]MDW8414123.1 2-oxo acid dehydrogenase subunit E2 [Thermaurantiacus sp.]